MSRHMWRLGVVLKLIEGWDGFSYSPGVLVAKTDSRIKRALSKLYPAEHLRQEEHEEHVAQEGTSDYLPEGDARLQSQLVSNSDTVV